MYSPSLKEFLKLSSQGNVIPVYRQVNADLDTPVSIFLKIQKGDYAFLLESVEGQEKVARYSFLGSNPAFVFRSKPGVCCLDEIKRIMRNFKAVRVRGLPRFYGGLVGYMGYDTVRFFEGIPNKNPDELKVADCIFLLTDTILIFDHINHSIKIVKNVILPKAKKISTRRKEEIYRAAVKKIDSIYALFGQPLKYGMQENAAKFKVNKKITSNFTRQGFKQIVKTAKRYIKRGDIIQVVLSQRFKLKIGKKHPFEIYRNLRSLNPSPYMYYLKLKDLVLVGSSPEMLVRCENGHIETRPIAGTRPRGKDDAQDNRLAQELISDEKERAEHLMLVDLGRNDLGRVSKPGSIRVSEFMRVEKYSHVMHLVSEVEGRLDSKRYDIYDVLKASFPAGTVCGSPKIRAMEIIDELENVRRGPYAGCVGYFSFSHNMDTCITIRTVIIKDKTAYIQAGAGIVADSIPEKEYQESVNKARALIESVTT